MVTDPPYGVEYDPDWRNQALRADGTATDGRAVGTVANRWHSRLVIGMASISRRRRLCVVSKH